MHKLTALHWLSIRSTRELCSPFANEPTDQRTNCFVGHEKSACRDCSCCFAQLTDSLTGWSETGSTHSDDYITTREAKVDEGETNEWQNWQIDSFVSSVTRRCLLECN